MRTFYITTPIFYPNAKLHLGHAYTTTVSDILARYHRLKGRYAPEEEERVYFLTGSDENTQKILPAAKAVGQRPEDFLEGVVANFKNLFSELDISYDQFIRTSDEKIHWPGAQLLWQKLQASGDIYKKEYEGLYCVGHEAFLTPKDLVDGKCPEHGEVPKVVREENYFFRLSRYSEAVRTHIESGEIAIFPETRKHEILSLLREGLQDVSFSRPTSAGSIGVPVPGDKTQVMYVWCDALANYLTALGFGQSDEKLYREFWPAQVHVMGKDILRFHAAIWPAMLLSANLPLPKALLVHGFIVSGGRKMSKSLGNVIDPEELITAYGADALRFYLARHISPFEDSELTRESFKDAYNADLANGLGNLAARILTLAESHLPEPVVLPRLAFPREFSEALERFEVNAAAELVATAVQKLDQKITATAPFKVVKENPEKGRECISELVADLAAIVVMLEPVIPATARKIWVAIQENKKPETLFLRK